MTAGTTSQATMAGAAVSSAHMANGPAPTTYSKVYEGTY